jgi:phosphoglycolate phosphatase-like HAD superfamily hydrolase
MDGSIDLVIFDCDGVLVDSEILPVEVDKRIRADLGWELTTDDIVERFLGRSSADFAGGLTPAAWLEAEGATVFYDMSDLPELVAAHALGMGSRRPWDPSDAG